MTNLSIAELKQQRRWVLWKLEEVAGKLTKVPHQPGGYKASIRNPEHLHTYAELEPHAANFSGIGLALGTIDGLSVWGVDIDKCCDAAGKFSDEAQHVITDLDTYAERSPSGTGCHIWGLGTLPGQGLQKPYPGAKQIEVKADGYYQTYTGRQIPDTPAGLAHRQEEITALYTRVCEIQKTKTDGLVITLPISSEEKIKALMAGDMSAYDDDHSRADLALCTLLAMKHGGDAFRVEDEFNKSQLVRDKWFDRDDYRHGTITKAIIAAIQNGAAETAAPSDEPKDWRLHYHTAEEHDHVEPPCFLIEGFLPVQSIMGIGAFVGQKKTLAALNISFSLCSGKLLFGKYTVTRKPARVLYLGPENGLISFSDRVNRIGLREYLGKTFFYATMSMPEQTPLGALMPEEVADAAIVIDTAIRFTDGNENDATHMKEFAKQAFSLIRNGAACVIMLHHSPKGMTKAAELTLENSFRGTGELSAFLSVALAMRTQDMDNEYDSPSLLRFVKQRDFEPKPSSFEVTTNRETCRMEFVDGSHGATVTKKSTADLDGKDDEAVAMMKANPRLSGVKMSKLLKDAAGIKRSKEWVRLKRGELGIGGLQVGEVRQPL